MCRGVRSHTCKHLVITSGRRLVVSIIEARAKIASHRLLLVEVLQNWLNAVTITPSAILPLLTSARRRKSTHVRLEYQRGRIHTTVNRQDQRCGSSGFNGFSNFILIVQRYGC